MKSLRATGFVVLCLAVVVAAGWAQRTSHENQVRDRGQTPNQLMTLHPYQNAGREWPITINGILVDASCKNRSLTNLLRSPQPLAARTPEAESPGGTSGNAQGISVSGGVLQGEREDIMPHQVPDMRTRQMDPTCAVTAATVGYALLLPGNRLLDLDEGGNTLALQAIQSTPAGRAMLNGMGPGVKPDAELVGIIHHEKLIVQKIIRIH